VRRSRPYFYIYPELDDIDAITQAVKAGRSLSRAGLYWNTSCLKEIGSPKFWPKETLEPILAQYGEGSSGTAATANADLQRAVKILSRRLRSAEFRYRQLRHEPGQPDGDFGKVRPGSSLSSITLPRADSVRLDPTLSQPKKLRRLLHAVVAVGGLCVNRGMERGNKPS
jgi:hypothetical protein